MDDVSINGRIYCFLEGKVYSWQNREERIPKKTTTGICDIVDGMYGGRYSSREDLAFAHLERRHHIRICDVCHTAVTWNEFDRNNKEAIWLKHDRVLVDIDGWS